MHFSKTADNSYNPQQPNITYYLYDSFAYDGNSSDPGYGQVNSVTEYWPRLEGAGAYTVQYGYTPDGDRGTVTYTTSNGTNEWQYDNYASVGMPQSGGECSRVPQSMRQIVSGSPTAEEFHYQYDGGGRMMAATFAMTPASGYSPSSGQPWYTATELPSSRCRAVYDNDGGSHLYNLDYYWDNWNGSSYTSSEPFAYSYAYSTADTTFLKTGASLNEPAGSHNETYAYDQSGSEPGTGQSGLDYLTGASYGIGSNPNQNWTYDAAGNRASDSINGAYTCNDLNMLTKIGSGNYSNDVLGNRDSDPSGATYGWDQLNRLTSFASGNVTTNYSYRADGMRVQKSDSGGGSTSYAYDGQMGFEDDETGGSNPGVTDYAIGARGIDRIAFTSTSGTTVAYPILDGHGNMTATLSESGSSYSAGNSRSFDAWGSVIDGSGNGDPKGRYCANLGHKQDDESGLIYMRARYEDPTTGRFISSDPGMATGNPFTYCSSSPTTRIDANGKEDIVEVEGSISLSEFLDALAQQVSSAVQNIPRIGQQIWPGTPLGALMIRLGEDPEDWNYVEQQVLQESGASGIVKAFVRMAMDEEVEAWLISSGDDCDVIPHATPYLDGGPGSNTGIDPF